MIIGCRGLVRARVLRWNCNFFLGFGASTLLCMRFETLKEAIGFLNSRRFQVDVSKASAALILSCPPHT